MCGRTGGGSGMEVARDRIGIGLEAVGDGEEWGDGADEFIVLGRWRGE